VSELRRDILLPPAGVTSGWNVQRAAVAPGRTYWKSEGEEQKDDRRGLLGSPQRYARLTASGNGQITAVQNSRFCSGLAVEPVADDIGRHEQT
jgi:hypothetical protein